MTADYFFLPVFSSFVISKILGQSFPYSVRWIFLRGAGLGGSVIKTIYSRATATDKINSAIAKITVPIIVIVQIHFLSRALFIDFAF